MIVRTREPNTSQEEELDTEKYGGDEAAQDAREEELPPVDNETL
jgi:hypothetical protein